MSEWSCNAHDFKPAVWHRDVVCFCSMLTTLTIRCVWISPLKDGLCTFLYHPMHCIFCNLQYNIQNVEGKCSDKYQNINDAGFLPSCDRTCTTIIIFFCGCLLAESKTGLSDYCHGESNQLEDSRTTPWKSKSIYKSREANHPWTLEL